MFPQRSRPALLMTAAWGGLKSAPDSRLRRASRHLLYSLLRRTVVEPDGVADDLRRKTMPQVAGPTSYHPGIVPQRWVNLTVPLDSTRSTRELTEPAVCP